LRLPLRASAFFLIVFSSARSSSTPRTSATSPSKSARWPAFVSRIARRPKRPPVLHVREHDGVDQELHLVLKVRPSDDDATYLPTERCREIIVGLLRDAPNRHQAAILPRETAKARQSVPCFPPP
jgi:hypothetical protein